VRKSSSLAVALLAIAFLSVALLGLSACNRGPALIGTWTGAPQTREVVQKITKGGDPIAQNIAQVVAQTAANAFLSLQIEFRKDGTAFYSGNTHALRMPPEASGPWYEKSHTADTWTVRMGTNGDPFEARIDFRDRDHFVLTRVDAPDLPPISFHREGAK